MKGLGTGRRSFMWRKGRWLVVMLAALVTCSGCRLMWDPIDEPLVGPYRLIAIEKTENCAVVYDDGGPGLSHRVNAVVVDVGWDNRYLVATSRPQGKPGGPLSYYYLDMAEDTPASGFRAVTGPLTEAEFAQAKAELGLPDFTLHHPELR
jgi:hypothetical protein